MRGFIAIANSPKNILIKKILKQKVLLCSKKKYIYKGGDHENNLIEFFFTVTNVSI